MLESLFKIVQKISEYAPPSKFAQRKISRIRPCWSKSEGCEILAPLAKIRSRKKKCYGRNFEFWTLPLNQRGTNHVGPTLIQWQRSKLKIAAVTFFFTAPSPLIFFFTFDLTLTGYNYGSKTPNLENYHIFRMLWTCPLTWYHPR